MIGRMEATGLIAIGLLYVALSVAAIFGVAQRGRELPRRRR